MQEIAEQSYDLMEAYLTAQELAGKKIKDASEMLSAEEKKFAAENDINLIEDQSKKSAKLEKASKVYKYYNTIYLIFFKSYKQEAYLLDAMNKLDLNAMEQNKNALLEYAEEGLKKIGDIKAFGSDNSLIIACEEMLTFYKKEASKDMPVILDFYLKKEKYESIQKEFEENKKSKRPHDDINSMNKAGQEYNEAVAKYNEINESLNKNRTKQLDKWNNAAKKFTKKHI
jgi:hypothetical protein